MSSQEILLEFLKDFQAELHRATSQSERMERQTQQQLGLIEQRLTKLEQGTQNKGALEAKQFEENQARLRTMNEQMRESLGSHHKRLGEMIKELEESKTEVIGQLRSASQHASAASYHLGSKMMGLLLLTGLVAGAMAAGSVSYLSWSKLEGLTRESISSAVSQEYRRLEKEKLSAPQDPKEEENGPKSKRKSKPKAKK